jgi:ectoine hydroxylase
MLNNAKPMNVGYIIITSLFDTEEIRCLRTAMETDEQIHSHFYDRKDETGAPTKMALWNHLGDSAYSLAARSNRVVDTMEDLLGGEVYHYHSKLTAKEAFEGGAWEWHQDYGYWYANGCLFPLMASLMIALDDTTKENGCLQVLKGSQAMGRIEHGELASGQVGSEEIRTTEAAKRLETVYVEMKVGDGLFFHCNTLHRSDQNTSPNRRWTLICCYNAARNDPYLDHHHPHYTPIEKVPDDAVRLAGAKHANVSVSSAFMDKSYAPPEIKKLGV